MASYDASLGMWKGKNGQYYATQEDAVRADQNYLDDGDFFMGSGGIEGQAPDAPPPAAEQPNPNNPGGISDQELLRRKTALQTSATNTANINANQDRTSGSGGATPGSVYGEGGSYSNLPASTRAAYSYMHDLGDTNSGFTSARAALNNLGERAGVSHAGDSVESNPFAGGFTTPGGIYGDVFLRSHDPNTGLGSTMSDGSGLGGAPVTQRAARVGANALGPAGSNAATLAEYQSSFQPNQNAGRTGIDKETADAKTRALSEIDQNQDENAALFANAFDQYENLGKTDYGLSDEARGYQREGLQQQRQLLQKMLGFDEDQYARQYADRGLANSIALARSAGGGYASQQAGTMAAMEQAPSLYAEGARQASQLGTQRLAQAETAAKAFGDLGTMTRGQDEQRAQFESNLGLNIADSVARLTEGNVQMNQQDSQQMAEIWMDFAKLQSVYAGMDSDEQLAWWQNETARRGQDKTFEAIMAQMKQDGKITSKDLIGGLFQLGGGVLSAGGNIGAAYMQGQTARDVAMINAGY